MAIMVDAAALAKHLEVFRRLSLGAAAARARNLYVHRYWQIDSQRIFDELQDRFADLSAFARWTAERLARTLGGGSR